MNIQKIAKKYLLDLKKNTHQVLKVETDNGDTYYFWYSLSIDEKHYGIVIQCYNTEFYERTIPFIYPLEEFKIKKITKVLR